MIIESPYAGDVERNVAYARRCLLDSLHRGEAPIASHLLHTQVLDDAVPELRAAGLLAGNAWIRVADAVAAYEDYGLSEGMRIAIGHAESCGVLVEYRRIGVNK